MLNINVLKGVLGATAMAAMCTVLTGHAQTTGSQSGSGKTTDPQSTQPTGQTGTGTGATGTGTSGTGATGTGTGTGATGTGSSAGTATGSATGTGTQASTGAGGTGPLSASDQKMLKTMALNNLAEIEAGRMAQSKTQSEEVRSFAQRMIDDHTKALEDVRQLAQARGVSLPTELDRANKRKADRMASLSGEAFDRAYMAQAGVDDHKKNHALLQQAQTRAKDPDVKALAARTLPIVHEHLNSAQQLHKNTARGSSRTQGSTGSSTDKRE